MPLLLATLMACSSGDKAEIEKMEADVMAIHDEIMPKMGEIMELKAKLAEKLSKSDSTKAEYLAQKKMSDSLTNMLTDADNSMMDWMEGYDSDSLKTLNKDGAKTYLSNQKSKIEAVKKLTQANIEAAKAYLQKP